MPRATSTGIGFLLGCFVLQLVGCGGSPTQPTAPASPPYIARLSEGQSTQATITSTSEQCAYVLDTGAVEGPCQIFEVVPRFGLSTRSMKVHVDWATDDHLALVAPSGTAPRGLPATAVCCRSPLDLLVRTLVFEVTPLSVVYTGPMPLDHEVRLSLSTQSR